MDVAVPSGLGAFPVPDMLSLSVPSKAHKRYVIELTSAGGELLDGFDGALAQRRECICPSLHRRIQAAGLEFAVLLVHNVCDTIGKCQEAVTRRKSNLMRVIIDALD